MVFGVKAAIASLTTLYGYLGALGVRAQALDHIWSLCVEEHAYLVLGLLALLGRLRRLPVAPILLAASFLSMLDGAVSTLVLHQTWYTAYWRSDAHVAPVFLSAALSSILMRECKFPAFLWWASALAGAVVFVVPVPNRPALHFGHRSPSRGRERSRKRIGLGSPCALLPITGRSRARLVLALPVAAAVLCLDHAGFASSPRLSVGCRHRLRARELLPRREAGEDAWINRLGRSLGRTGWERPAARD